MVKKIALLALLAAFASAVPIANDNSPRTLPSWGGFGPGAGSGSGIAATKGWTTGVASSLEACAVGVTSGCIDKSSKAALLSWIAGAGAAFFDDATCQKIITWCTSSSDVVLESGAQMAMEGVFVAEHSISAAGGMLSFFNGVIGGGFSGESCACSVMGSGDQASLSGFLSGSGAALESIIFGSLKMCASGGIAEGLSSGARAALSSWLSGSSCSLSENLKRSVEGWLSGSTGGSTSEGAGGHGSGYVGGNVVLGGAAMGSLSTFMSGSAFKGLGMEIQGGLHACAAGGVSSSLSGAMQASLSGWLSSSSCTMDADLKASMQAWMAGTVTATTQTGTPGNAYGYISMGASIAGSCNSSGYMETGAQASLSSFCGSSAGLSLDSGVLSSLKSCASGHHPSSLDSAAASALAQYLASSSCSMVAEMRGSVMFWLSFGVTGASGASKGVGMGAGGGFTFPAGMAGQVSSAVSAGFNMSSSCKGAMGVAIAGEAAWAVSGPGRAEFIGYLISGEAAGMSGEVERAMFGWVMGSDCSGVKKVGTGSTPTTTGSAGSSSSNSASATSTGSSVSQASSTCSSASSGYHPSASYPTVPYPTGSTISGYSPFGASPSSSSTSTGSSSIPSVNGSQTGDSGEEECDA